MRICAECDSPCAGQDVYDAAGAASVSELNGLQHLTAARPLAGLMVQRRIFVPSAGQDNANGFVRYVDLLTNPTGAPITVNVKIGSVLVGTGSLNGAAATLWRTSNDDAVLEPADRWLVLDDDDAVGGGAATAHLLYGAGATYRPTRVAQRYVDVNAAGALAWDFEQVTVAPGETISFMTLLVHEARRADAIVEVGNLLRARDADVLFGLTDDQRLQIRNYDVDPANGAPLASAGGPYNAIEGSPVQLSAVRSFDPEGLPLEYAWDLDGDGEFDDAVGVNTVTEFVDDGVFQVAVRVTDNGGKQDVDRARVVIINSAPRLDRVSSDSPIDEGQNLTLDISVSDPGQDELFVDVDWDGDGTYDDSDLEGVLFEHRYFADGVYMARVRLRDDEGDFALADFPVEVRNVAPRISGVVVPPRTVEGTQFNIQVVASDGGNDPIRYGYDLDDDGVYEIDEVGRDQVTTSFGDDGLYNVGVRVCDDQEACATRNASVNIDNGRPIINSVSNNGPVVEGQIATITVDAVDPGDDPLTYSYDLDNDGEYDGAIDRVDALATTSFDQQGQYTVGVRVRDDDGGFVLGSTVVTVENAPPVARLIVPAFVNEGEEFEVRAEATDAGDDVLAYDWDITGDGEFDLLGVPDAIQHGRFDQQGDYPITVRVFDGDGGEVTVSEIIQVRNVLPVLQVEVESPAFEGAEVVVRAVAEDPGDDALVFDFDFDGDGSVDAADVPGVRDGNSWIANARFAYPDQGAFEISVFVEDGGEVRSGTADIVIQNVAPSITLQTNTPVEEGSELVLTAEVSDPGDDTVTLSWDTDGDGEADVDTVVDGEDGTVQTVIAPDDDRFNVTVWARDEDGGESSDTSGVIIVNVAPSFREIPVVPPALELARYNFRPEVDDPGGENDPPIFSLVNPPPGVGIDRNSGQMDWIPNYDQYLASPVELTISVSDGDGGQDQIQISVDVLPSDEDGDGIPDTFERNACDDEGHCLNPRDGADGTADSDGDGRDNETEWREGTDPWQFDGPDMPELQSPTDGAQIATNTPELQVGPVRNPLEEATYITFEIYEDLNLEVKVIESEPIEAADGVPTTWRPIDGVLLENVQYWWRARAESGPAESDWTFPWAFRVNAVNEPPTAPTPRAPEDGAVVDTKRPALEVLPSMDIDGDELRYIFRVYRGAGEDAVAETSGEGLVMDGFVRFVPPGDLNDDRTISWDVVAVDAASAESPPSERWTFTINTDNDAPSTPTIVFPMDEQMVDTLRPEFVAEGSVDDDNPDVFYVFRVRPRDGMEYVAESADILGVDEQASWTPEADLEEDTHYVLDVHATDGEAQSEGTASAAFFVSAVNDPPSVPQPTSPADGGKVQPDEVFVIWDESIDPEEDPVVYVVEWCDSTGDCEQSQPTESRGYELTDLVRAGETYTWTVQAFDLSDIASEPSEARTFVVEDSGGGGGGDDGGCACDSAQSRAPWSALALVVLLGVLRRRR